MKNEEVYCTKCESNTTQRDDTCYFTCLSCETKNSLLNCTGKPHPFSYPSPTINPTIAKEENPQGLYHRYNIEKANGEAVDPNAEYFILRLDLGGSDIEHINACRIGVNAYADAIEHHLPQLAADLKTRYPLLTPDQVKDFKLDNAWRTLSKSKIEIELKSSPEGEGFSPIPRNGH